MRNSQNQQIRQALLSGRKLTQMGAIKEFKCLRLASRIADLKKAGMAIHTEMRTRNGKKFAEYSLLDVEA